VRTVPADRQVSRRAFLHSALAAVPLVAAGGVDGPDGAPAGYVLQPADDQMLDDLCRRSLACLFEQGDPRTGLVRDRARADGSMHAPDRRDIASISATGFALAALSVAHAREWMPREALRQRVRTTLAFLAREMPHERGWFYHFVDARTGARVWNGELASIDTALLLAGVLTARRAFADDPAIVADATRIYERVDFPWMLGGHPLLFTMGWKPESGFLEARWRYYCELMILYLLGIGSPTHPLPRASWQAWDRPRLAFGGYRIVSHGDPLFVHQFSHAFVDFRGRTERGTGIDWWQNSVDATAQHKAFCLSLRREFPGYGDDEWGITASDSEQGYVAWGGPPRDPRVDGSLVPCAAGGSLMVSPALCVPVIRRLRERWGDRIYRRYGFVDAFNPNTSWTNHDVVGIDVGITLLSAENLRSGRVWEWFMANPEIPRALELAGVV
jgi:hypothetical protein